MMPLLPILVLLPGCGENTPLELREAESDIVGIEISPQVANLEPMDTERFTARGITSTGASVPTTVVWMATGGSIDENGRYIAGNVGSFEVMATHSARAWVSDTAEVSVTTVASGGVNHVEVSPASSEILAGETLQLVAVALDPNDAVISGLPVAWRTNSAGVATVDEGGLVTGRSTGSALITAEIVGISGSASLTVEERQPVDPIFEEDFSGYSNTAALLSDPRDVFVDSEDQHAGVVLDTGEGFGPSDRSMRYDWPAGGCTDYTRNRKVVEFPSQDEVWIEVVAKFSPQFDTDTRRGCTEAAAYKFLFFTSASGAYGNRFQLVNGVFGDRWDAGHATDQVAYIGRGPLGHNPLWDGRWHTYRFHLRLGSTDGIFRLAIDGVPQIVEANISTNNGGGLNSFNWLVLGANINQGPLNAASLWWGAVRIWNENPGWSW